MIGLPSLLNLLAASLPLLWLVGVRSKNLYLVITLLLLMSCLSKRMRSITLPLHPRLWWSFIVLYLLYIPVSQAAKCLTGQQGVDFALLAQSLENHFLTTLLGPGPVHLLTHHFSPILAITFPFTAVGIPGWVCAVTLHTASIIGAVYLFYKIAQELKLSSPLSLLGCTVLLLHPNLRVSLFWETHDEIVALPLLGLAVLLFLRDKHWGAAFSLVGAMLFKETFFFLPPFFVLMQMVKERRERTLPYVTASIVGALGVLLYILFPPFPRSFDSMSRLGSMSELLSGETLIAKLKFCVVLFLPMLGIPVLSREGRILSLAALPFIGMILVSRGEVMYHLYNYYSVIPTFLLAIGGLGTVTKIKEVRTVPVALMISISLTLGAFSHPKHAPSLMLKEGALPLPPLEQLPEGSRVATSDYTALHFVTRYTPVRWGLAENGTAPWSFVALRPSEASQLTEEMKRQSIKIYEDRHWVVYKGLITPPSKRSVRSPRRSVPEQRAPTVTGVEGPR